MDSYIKDIIDREFKDQYVKKALYLIIPNLITYYGEKYLNTSFDERMETNEYENTDWQEIYRGFASRPYFKIADYFWNTAFIF